MDDGLWQVRLEHQRMPIRLQVMFTTSPRAAEFRSSSLAIQVPRLEDVAADQTLWTVHHANQFELVTSRQHPVSQPGYRIVRLRNLFSQLQDAMEVASNSDQRDLQRWLQQWEPYWRWDRERLEDSPAAQSLTDEQAAELSELDNQFRQVADRLQAAGASLPPQSSASYTVRPYDGWGSPAISVAGQTHFLTEPKSSDEVVPAMGLELAASATTPASFGRFAALSVSCLLLGAGVVLLVFRGDWRDRLVPPPIFVWILLCLAWWLWLTPSWLGPVGLLLVLVRVLARRMSRFRRQKWAA
jgi:hypothetical protein